MVVVLGCAGVGRKRARKGEGRELENGGVRHHVHPKRRCEPAMLVVSSEGAVGE